MAKTSALRYQNLFKYINKFKPKSIMDIGVWNGLNAKKMIEAALHFHSTIKYIGFDLFENITYEEILAEKSKTVKATFESVRAVLEKISNAEVQLFVGYTRETIPLILTEHIDFISIDGGHSLETINTDWNNIQRFIYPKTIIILDDYWESRADAGCKLLIDSLDRKEWDVALLNPVDVFYSPEERRIRMVRVMRKF